MQPDVPRDARALLGWTRTAVSIPAHSRIAAPPCSSPTPFPSLFLATAAIVIEAYLIFLLFDCAGYILTFSLASSSQNISQFALILHDFMSNEEKKYLYKLTAKSIVRAMLLRLGGLKVRLAQGNCVGEFKGKGSGRVFGNDQR